mgnify:CR=1 FL=1
MANEVYKTFNPTCGKSQKEIRFYLSKIVEQMNSCFVLHKILLREKMNLNEAIDEVKKAFFDTKKIKCKNCKYKSFSNNMEKLQLAIEELNLIKAEFLEKTGYENNRFSKIFKPALVYVGAPALAAYITNYIQKEFSNLKNFWLGLFFLIIIFATIYFLFGAAIAVIMLLIDSCGKNAKEKQLIRFLDKYIKEKKWKSIHSK